MSERVIIKMTDIETEEKKTIITELNGSRMAVNTDDVSVVIQCILELLGYDVEIKLNE